MSGPDVVLLDVMMPSMDGFEVCWRLKAEPRTQHIPVIMITALDQPSDRVKGLEAGADDFLTKPVDDIALITRVKNLARLKMLTDEMLMRASTEEQMGFAATLGIRLDKLGRGGRILVVEDRDRSAERITEALKDEHHIERETDPSRALLTLPDGDFDLMIVSLSLQDADGLRLCSQMRSLDRIRHLPIMMVVESGDDARLLRGLDMGVNDYIVRPVDPNELVARVRTQIKRKRYTDFLRTRLEETVEMAILDPLTALHNRRYMTSHLRRCSRSPRNAASRFRCSCSTSTISRRSTTATGMTQGIPSSANSPHGSDAISGIDLACRLGGEEFVVVMPDTDLAKAYLVGERLRQCIAAAPFYAGERIGTLEVTASVGVAATPELILSRPTRRSTAPSATAATGLWRVRPDDRAFGGPLRESVAISAGRGRFLRSPRHLSCHLNA